jgi:aminoglycoside phosphotransferase (APT) family kinase protein
VHGDFNTNNVLYDERLDRVHFIDVHRSGPGDYAQDIGVLLVSNLRTPIADGRLVRQLERLNGLIEEFAVGFGELVGDTHVRARLVLSQARSYLTSSRLVTDRAFARFIYLKGVRWLERALDLGAAA